MLSVRNRTETDPAIRKNANGRRPAPTARRTKTENRMRSISGYPIATSFSVVVSVSSRT
jgi:hypothetical protein